MPTYHASHVTNRIRFLPGLVGTPRRSSQAWRATYASVIATWSGKAQATAAFGKPGMKSPGRNHWNSRGRLACQ
jgi:hypothetical protein